MSNDRLEQGMAEGNGSSFPYFYHHLLLHLALSQGEPDVAFSDDEESSSMFRSSSSSSATREGGEGGGNPTLFPQSTMATAAGDRASVQAPMPVVKPACRKRGRPRKYAPTAPSSSPPPTASTSPATPSFFIPSTEPACRKRGSPCGCATVIVGSAFRLVPTKDCSYRSPSVPPSSTDLLRPCVTDIRSVIAAIQPQCCCQHHHRPIAFRSP